ncbi:MAG: penicillin-binding protein 1A [bacterium]
MTDRTRRRTVWYVLFGLAAMLAVAIGVATGVAIAQIRNTPDIDIYGRQEASLPSQLLDRDGEVITEFFADERRELVAIDELPRHLIYALITREDRRFFEHGGFDFVRTSKAAFDLARRRYSGGGSTLTQQLAGTLFADRSEFSIARKLRELWWALQLERHWTKQEILERYLNTMFFGHGNYGVEAASQYYFGHSARDLTIAESAMLVIQLANPSLYSPIRRPNNAREMQRNILNQMAELGYTSQEEVDESFQQYWSNYDFTRSSISSAWSEREDQAPYFSEYVRQKLENELLLGSININKDGYTIHTTLDLDYQRQARRYVDDGLLTANEVYRENTQERVSYGEELVPFIELLSLSFDVGSMRIGDARRKQNAKDFFLTEMYPLLDITSMQLTGGNAPDLRHVAQRSKQLKARQAERTTVQGALITLENDTGHILAMIGGSGFESASQFNRAVDASVEPGSSFKPLYYAAAIEDEVITPATSLYDSHVVFWNDDGTPYTPLNYRGEWSGWVRAREALSRSMNVPSLRILERVGFDTALTTARRLMGIPRDEMADRNLVRRYPVGLGIVEVAPIEMAKAFATFANQGREVVPIAVRYIEDRNGRIILEPEQQVRLEQQRKGDEAQIVSPQTAYIMTDMLQTTVESGTLRYPRDLVGGFDLPTAGKTGTTQNWADAWTLGYTPYYTTAVWFGFDRGGSNSLGTNQTGAVTTGPVWARYMKAIHEGLGPREFIEPTEGLTRVTVTEETGLLPTENYTGETYEEVFISGTEPREFDQLEDFDMRQRPVLVNRLRRGIEDSAYRLDGSVGSSEESTPSKPELDLTLELDLDVASRSDTGSSPDSEQDGEEGNPLLD